MTTNGANAKETKMSDWEIEVRRVVRSLLHQHTSYAARRGEGAKTHTEILIGRGWDRSQARDIIADADKVFYGREVAVR